VSTVFEIGNACGEQMSASFEPARRPIVLAGLCALLGLILIGGGVRLVALGGSSYYLLLGLALAATAVLTWLRRPAAAWVFAAATLGTLVWAIAESGLDPWALLPRSCHWRRSGYGSRCPACSARSRAAAGLRMRHTRAPDDCSVRDCSWPPCC
jgi:hypothetical protein